MDGSRVRDQDLERGASWLTPLERQRHSRFIRPERQRQYLLGRMLLRHAIGSCAAIPVQAVGVIERPGLAPLLALSDGVPPPAFSLSHSRQWIACAVSADAAVGLDIEVMDSGRDVLALSEAAFDRNEQLFMRQQNESDRIAAFYQVWTMKEALFKLSSERAGQTMLPSVADAHGRLRAQGDGWFSSILDHPELCISICCSRAFAHIATIEPAELLSGPAAA